MQGKTLLLALATCAALAACGGGDDDTTTTAAGTGTSSGTGAGAGTGTGTGGSGSAAAPGNVFGSVEALLAYMRQVLGGSDDTAEPVALPASAAPTTETGEPAAI